MVQAAAPEGGHQAIELGADPADLALADPGIDAQGGHQVIDFARADPVDVGLHDHRPQGPVDPPARFEQGRQERARPELGDAQLDVAGLGAEQPAAAAVAVGDPLVGPLIAPGADRLAGLELDQLLEDQAHRVAQDVSVAPGTNCLEQLGQGRL